MHCLQPCLLFIENHSKPGYFMLASFSDSDVVVLEVLETITGLLAFVVSQLHTLILQLHLPPNALTKQNCLGKCANILLLT